MGTFDIHTNAPGLLRVEALNMKLTFQRTGPTSGLISWNIPQPAAGCAAGTQAYDGIVVVVSTKELTPKDVPVDDLFYEGDTTLNPDLYAGDKINEAFVVATFYDDRTTTSVTVTDLEEDANYYVAGFPVDAQRRYFTEGVRAYSQATRTSYDSQDTKGFQIIKIASGKVLPVDKTTLDPLKTYTMSIRYQLPDPQLIPKDLTDCNDEAVFDITVNGASAQTYGSLLDALNWQFAQKDSPYTGTTSPNVGSLWFDEQTNTVYKWMGSEYNNIAVAVRSNVQLTSLLDGTYWYNNDTLFSRQASLWKSVDVVNGKADPTVHSCGHFWVNTSIQHTYSFDGNIWNLQACTYSQTEPDASPDNWCGALWLSQYKLYTWDIDSLSWIAYTKPPCLSVAEPTSVAVGSLWFDHETSTLYQASNINPVVWDVVSTARITETVPDINLASEGTYWINPTTNIGYIAQTINGTRTWIQVYVCISDIDPTASSDYVWVSGASAFVWDALGSKWVSIASFFSSTTEPVPTSNVKDGDLWFSTALGRLFQYSNQCFKEIDATVSSVDPDKIVPPQIWFDGATFKKLTASGWVAIDVITWTTDPALPPVGSYWFTTAPFNQLYTWNGISWVAVAYTSRATKPTKGQLWFDGTHLYKWNGVDWQVEEPFLTAAFDCNGEIRITNNSTGSKSLVDIMHDASGQPAGTLIPALGTAYLAMPRPGSDAIPSVVMTDRIGVGTDGSNDERLKVINEIRYNLGYPTVDVELTPEQLDLCVTKALEELRLRSDVAYRRGYFSMAVQSETQVYQLTNKTLGYDKIVTIMGIYRMTSAFISSAHGAGVYGQVMLQQLYNMGTFDMLSYHIMSEYTELLEILFAARITYSWHEDTRMLRMFHRFPMSEPRVLIEASVERTEQDLLKDRWCRPWLRRWATALARESLAEIRGKFGSLPGAGGNVTLNSADLRQQATDDFTKCLEDIDNNIVSNMEEFGSGVHIMMG